MKKLLIVLFSLLLSLLTLIAGPVLAQDKVLHVDAGAKLGTISPYVYGANYGGYSFIPPDSMETAAAAGMNILRFPGGSTYDKDGKGEVPNYLIDLFMIQCKQLGIEPSIQVRLLGGAPDKAADLVHYVNIEKQYNVRYWYIGNEPNLYGQDYTTETLNTEWRAIALAMREVDPNIILIGPELSQYPGITEQNPKDANGKDWLDEFLIANGDLVDIVSIHRYPFPQGKKITTIEDLRNNAKEWDTIIPHMRERIETLTGSDKPVAVTEINSHWNNLIGGEATPDSTYHAIWLADALGRIIRQQTEIVTYFDFFGAPDRGLALFTKYDVRPTYYTYQLYQHFGTELVISSADDDLVTIYAAEREDGALTLMVVNLGDEEATRTLDLANFTPSGAAEVWRFDAEHNAEMIESAEIDNGSTLTLPGQSITLYVLPG